MIHEWKNTLCVSSKYKEDLVHIRDMHRLLSYKGKFVDSGEKAFAYMQDIDSSLLMLPELCRLRIRMK